MREGDRSGSRTSTSTSTTACRERSREGGVYLTQSACEVETLFVDVDVDVGVKGTGLFPSRITLHPVTYSSRWPKAISCAETASSLTEYWCGGRAAGSWKR